MNQSIKEQNLKNYNGKDRIVPSIEVQNELKKIPENPVRFKTGFSYLDSLIEPIEGGEMITITGLTKRGKTLWTKSLLKNFSEKGIKAVVFQYESPYTRYLKSWGETPPLFYMPLELRNKTSSWLEDRIYEAKLKYDISVVIIDPVNKLLDYEKRQSPTIQINSIVSNLKDICLTHNIVIFVLAHARRLEKGATLDENIVRESQILASESDRLWIINRLIDKSTKQFTTETELIISLERESGFAMGKRVLFEYKDGLLYEKDLLDNYSFIDSKEDDNLRSEFPF